MDHQDQHDIQMPKTDKISGQASKRRIPQNILSFLRYIFSPTVLPGVTALVLLLYLVIFRQAGVDIEFNRHGATIITRGKNDQKATILLSANKLWLNTGILVKPDSRIYITASGAVNLAIHRLVESANKHVRPRLGWLGPEGANPPYPTDLDNGRNQFLVLPGAPYGTVLACIAPEGNILSVDNPRPPGVVVALAEHGISSKDGGILWLCVNDVVLSDNAENAYVASQPVLDKVYGPGIVTEEARQKEWIDVKNSHYFEAFFDDNSGEFLVQIDLSKHPEN